MQITADGMLRRVVWWKFKDCCLLPSLLLPDYTVLQPRRQQSSNFHQTIRRNIPSGVICILLPWIYTEVYFYQTTRCYNPEDSNLHTHRRENLKSYLMEVYRRFRGACCLQQAPVKSRPISTRLHGATSQKTVIIILAAVRTWYLT
jgi:hypothetical protein